VQNSNRSLQIENLQNLLQQNIQDAEYFFLDKTIVVAYKHRYQGKWSSSEEEEFRKMRTLDHEKLNRFLGVSISENFAFYLWSYCERGDITVSILG
jgi:aspartate/methionine/tyrosine aminotransferase